MTNEKLIKKVIEIMADYKFNDTQISTAEMTAQRIIDIVKESEKDDTINKIINLIVTFNGEDYTDKEIWNDLNLALIKKINLNKT